MKEILRLVLCTRIVSLTWKYSVHLNIRTQGWLSKIVELEQKYDTYNNFIRVQLVDNLNYFTGKVNELSIKSISMTHPCVSFVEKINGTMVLMRIAMEIRDLNCSFQYYKMKSYLTILNQYHFWWCVINNQTCQKFYCFLVFMDSNKVWDYRTILLKYV